ncbi:protein vreteno [Anopheles nili]|uniref:protein vreteno n=1 Tax=Anopheles nili TaxID=185578 RepID=UPI00237B4540|nr:protein vreteno [Anopheles nili]
MENRSNDADLQSLANCKIDEERPTKPLNTIIVHNVQDLTKEGLRRLCNNYGTVVNEYRIKNNDTAFVTFHNENEATLAVHQLNSKLGFGYRASLAYPKESTSKEESNVKLLSNENWDLISANRRSNAILSLPLPIVFPQQKLLNTIADYQSTNGGELLRKIDPESIFRVYKVLELENNDKTLLYDKEKRQKRLSAYQKACKNEENHSDRNRLTYFSLNAKERQSFKENTFCVVCKGYGFVHCIKCKTYYCSAQHQNQDYAAHKLTCQEHTNSDVLEGGKKKEVADVFDLALRRDPLPAKPKVLITTVLTPDRIYVRLADPAAQRDYAKTLLDSAKAARTTASFLGDTEPIVGEIYLAPYAPLGSHCRVLLTEVDLDVSKCVFIEYGTVQYVNNDALMEINDNDLKYRKVSVYKVCLANVTDELGALEDAMEYLNNLKNRQLKMTYKQEQNNLVNVQLHTSSGDIVNDKINSLITIDPILSDKAYESYIMYEDIAQSHPNLGENRGIMILNRITIQFDGRVTWIANDDLPYLENLQNKLQHYGKKVSEFHYHYTPRIGELCLVRCCERWYRGVGYETIGDGKPTLFLCDFGCMVEVCLSNVRRIPHQLATEVRTHDGVVQGLLQAKNDLNLDSFFLDIYLPENEVLQANIKQETFKEPLPGLPENEVTNIVLDMHEFSNLLQSRQQTL